MRLCMMLILGIFSVVNAHSESWQCRNDLEIACSDGKCEAKISDGFTPMSVSFDDAGKMSVCAYTGCWEGMGKVTKTDNFLTLIGKNLEFSTAGDMTQNIAITLDKSDNIAMLKAGSFAHPLVCKRKETIAGMPEFGQYKVSVSKAKPKPIKFSGNRNARMFRTRLGQALNGGVNFAGQYIFTTWGCGTSCVQGAIIDTKTGDVHFPKELGVMTFGYLEDDDEPLQYQVDSKLFILKGTPGDNEDNAYGTYYFVWEGTKFKQVKFVAKEN